MVVLLAWHTRCMSTTRYSVEFQARCAGCAREVDVVSLRVVGEKRGQAGLVYSRHLRPRVVGEIRGLCQSSLEGVARPGMQVAGAGSSAGAGSGSGKKRAKGDQGVSSSMKSGG